MEPSIKCRLASPNHKRGEFNAPTKTNQKCILPDIGEVTLPDTAYSSTSQVLNIDTADLGLQNFGIIVDTLRKECHFQILKELLNVKLEI